MSGTKDEYAMLIPDWGYKHKEHEVVSYDDIDFTDRKQVIAARNSTIREQWIKTMEQRLVRDELAKCYKSEGVNHYVNCRHLAERYLSMLKEHKHVTGYAYDEVRVLLMTRFLERTIADQ